MKYHPTPRALWLGALLAAALLLALLWPRPQSQPAPAAPSPPEPMSLAAKQAREEATQRQAQTAALPGREILQEYAQPGTRPEDDLHALAHAFANLQLLIKSRAPFRLGANEEFAAALLGKNADKLVFLAPPHACLNAQGQLIDRWGTPLFFHVRDASRIDIRSAGPDRVLWTADDLHRQADGQFIPGASLPPESAGVNPQQR